MKSTRLLTVALIAGLVASAAAFAQTAVVESVNNLFNKAQTYTSTAKVTLAATPTVAVEFKGSATKTVYVKSIDVACTKTNSGYSDITLVRMSAPIIDGTSSVISAVFHDSTNTGATAVLNAFTANPTVGATSGLSMVTMLAPFLSTSTTSISLGSDQGTKRIFGALEPTQYLVLRGTSQTVTVHFNAQTLTGAVCYFTYNWMEQ